MSGDGVDERFQWQTFATDLLKQMVASAAPRRHNKKNRRAQRERKPSTAFDLDRVGREKRNVDGDKNARERGNRQSAPLPHPTRDDEHQ